MKRSEKMRAFRIDLVLKGVGRLRISSGTTQRREYERRKSLILDLYRDGRLDVLTALKAGGVSMVELLAAHREGGAHSLGAIFLIRPLWEAITETLPEMASDPLPGKVAETRNRYERSLKTLKDCGVLRSTAKVRDLEKVRWQDVRPHFGGEADWNHLRSALSAFLSAFLGDVMHPFRRAVVKRIEREKPPERVVDVSVEAFWKAHALLPVWAKDPITCLALTGLRMGEYIYADAKSLRHESHEIVVEGKSGRRVVAVSPQAWPVICAAIPARYATAPKAGQRNSGTWRYQRLEKAWRLATRETQLVCTLHDLRHLAAQLASDAGFSDGAIADQHGHEQVATTRRYTRRKNRRDVADATANAVLRKIG